MIIQLLATTLFLLYTTKLRFRASVILRRIFNNWKFRWNFQLLKKDSNIVWVLNGERGIWTLAPRKRPTPLAGAPLQPLEYFSSWICFRYSITLCFSVQALLYQKCILMSNIFWYFHHIFFTVIYMVAKTKKSPYIEFYLLYFSDADSYILFPWQSITVITGSFSTYNFRIASVPRSS